jgi:hypothetical protein
MLTSFGCMTSELVICASIQERDVFKTDDVSLLPAFILFAMVLSPAAGLLFLWRTQKRWLSFLLLAGAAVTFWRTVFIFINVAIALCTNQTVSMTMGEMTWCLITIGCLGLWAIMPKHSQNTSFVT